MKTKITHIQSVSGWMKVTSELENPTYISYLGHDYRNGDMFCIKDTVFLFVAKGVRGDEFDDPDNLSYIDNSKLKTNKKIMLKTFRLKLKNVIQFNFDSLWFDKSEWTMPIASFYFGRQWQPFSYNYFRIGIVLLFWSFEVRFMARKATSNE